MIYRRRHEDRVWHFCRNCVHWPSADYKEQTVEPRREVLCAACTEKTERLQCEVVPEPGAS